MGESRAFEFEGAGTPAEAAEALSRVAAGIRARRLSLSTGGDGITVRPGSHLSLAVKAIEKKGKTKIDIAIAWRREPGDEDA